MTERFRMQSATGGGTKLKRYEDIIFPDFDILDIEWGLKHVKDLKYRTGDIIMSSYPKCGTHWVGNMIWKMKTLDLSKRPADTLLEFGPADVYETMESPRLMATHLKPNRLPAEHIMNGGKIVLVLRNPKDAMVSNYYHNKNAVVYKNTQTWDEFFQSFVDGLLHMGSYFDYVQQWEEFLNEKPRDQQVEIIYYEDVQADLDHTMARLNKFIGFNRDAEYMDTVKAETTFKALRDQYALGKAKTNAAAMDEHGQSIIYRKGVVGDWKTHLTVAQSELIDKLMEERLKHGIINVKYEI